ncbi:type IV pilin protein [Candidatus Avelusimicrobium caledoniensis]|uniref:type IV pilin protein n=1 Tax=Candidatus Avelusimicrobium caledoniensis TaxID=3416220 RepID=UPI003D11B1EB
MNNKQAFTLIELLVVVLIIGILAAVAVPQYKMVVLKSQYTQLMAFGDAIHKAALAYQLANGHFPSRFDELSIDVPGTGDEQEKTYKDFHCILSADMSDRVDNIYCYFNPVDTRLSYFISYPNNKMCGARRTWEKGNKLCQNMTGKTTTPTTGGYGGDTSGVWLYRFN